MKLATVLKDGGRSNAPVQDDGAIGVPWAYDVTSKVVAAAASDLADSFQSYFAGTSGKSPSRLPEVQEQEPHGTAFTIAASAGGVGHPKMAVLDRTHLKIPKLGAVKVHGTTKHLRRAIDAGSFRVFSTAFSYKHGR